MRQAPLVHLVGLRGGTTMTASGWLVVFTLCARLSGWNELPRENPAQWFPDREVLERNLVTATDQELCAIDLATGERYDLYRRFTFTPAWEPCKAGGCR